MFKEILIGAGAGAALLLVGAGAIMAQRTMAQPGQPQASLETRIAAIAQQGAAASGMEQLKQHLAFAEQDQTFSVRDFCSSRDDADICRTEQHAGNRAVMTLFRQVVLRSDIIGANVANLCVELQIRDGAIDWRGTIDCIVSTRQRVADARRGQT